MACSAGPLRLNARRPAFAKVFVSCDAATSPAGVSTPAAGMDETPDTQVKSSALRRTAGGPNILDLSTRRAGPSKTRSPTRWGTEGGAEKGGGAGARRGASLKAGNTLFL